MQIIRFTDVLEQGGPEVVQRSEADMVGEFFTGLYAFSHRFFGMGLLGIEFNVQPLFHWPDDEETDPPGEDDAIRRHADQYFGPVGHFGK